MVWQEEMNTSQISPYQLKRFVKQLCVVSHHQYKKEESRKKLNSQLTKVGKSKKNISELSKKIDDLLYHEVMLSRLGRKKHLSPEVMQELRIMKREFELLKKERDELSRENEILRSNKGIASSPVTVKKVKKAKKKVLSETDDLKEKIKLLESQYTILSKDKDNNLGKLYKIKEKINLYKTRLKGL